MKDEVKLIVFHLSQFCTLYRANNVSNKGIYVVEKINSFQGKPECQSSKAFLKCEPRNEVGSMTRKRGSLCKNENRIGGVIV